MYVWLILIRGSALIGFFTAILLNKSWAIYVAGAIPWLLLLVAIVYTAYFTPYQGGGASMWPVAQLFGGTIAAAIGVVGYKLTHHFFKNDSDTRQ